MYEKLYHIMFNAATDALKAIELYNYGQAADILKSAQILAEGKYLDGK